MKLLLAIFLCVSAFAQEGVHPLSFDRSDLQALDSMIKGAEIVGIGESGHGSSGYLKARLKVIKHLVETQNFRTIILENGYLGSERFNTYLKDCAAGRTNPATLSGLVKKMNIIYANREVLETFSWLCQYNQAFPGDPVEFRGMDIWETPWDDRDVIGKIAASANLPEFTDLYNSAVNHCWGWTASNWTEAAELPEWEYLLRTWRVEPKRFLECEGALLNLEKTISLKRDVLIAAAGTDAVNLAEMAVKVQQTYQNYRDLYMVDFKRVLSMRDSTQAELTLLHHGRARVKKSILLAHNIHVSKKQSAVILRAPNRMHWIDVRSTGELLRGHLGRAYKSIALTGYQVSSSRDGDYPVPTAADSLDLTLSSRGEFLLVDPKSPWIRDQREWWMHLEGDENGSFLVPEEQYDAIIFLRESKKAEGIEDRELD